MTLRRPGLPTLPLLLLLLLGGAARPAGASTGEAAGPQAQTPASGAAADEPVRPEPPPPGPVVTAPEGSVARPVPPAAAGKEEEAPAAAPEEKPAPRRRSGSPWAVAAALFPGPLLPGAGHFVLGERDAALRYLAVDGVGVGLLGFGFGGLVLSGGNDQLAPVFMLPVTVGMSALTLAWLSDLLGSAHGTDPWPAPFEPRGSLAVAAGYTGLFGSRLDLSHGLDLGLTWRLGSFAASPWGRLDPSRSYYGMGSRFCFVVWQAADAVTRLGLGASVAHHRFRFDRYSTTFAELHLELRLNLGYLTRTLRNAWLLARLGGGAELFAYDAVPLAARDLSPVLVAEMGAGVQPWRRLTVELLYRSHKSELPGGMIWPGVFDSSLGQFDLQGRVLLSERFSALGGVRWGSGLMPWIAVESQLF